ncbi:MAG: cytochrome c3 family protein [Phycisphaerales bacterium]
MLLCPLLLCASAAAQPASVVDSPHNLSAGGTGPVRATIEDQVCIFCHAPHNAAPARPLWNRATPPGPYSIYTSPSLNAAPGQPTGNSKMCLSCHDGTIALGSVVSRGTPIHMAAGITTIPPGASNLGTDLSDDHPVSFRYDPALAGKDPGLKDPSALPPQVRLDHNSELQCTSCHDSHSNALGKFLVVRNDSSQLCLTCHQVGHTAVAGHGNCSDCHQPHTAPSGPFLLKRATVSETCLMCHDGSRAGAANIAADLGKLSTHDVRGTGAAGLSGPRGRIGFSGHASELDGTSCTDCHQPHTMGRGSAAAPAVHPSLGRIGGVNASGAAVTVASYESEVCFACHGDKAATPPAVPRRIVQNNTRLEFSPSAVSSHPVQTPGRGAGAESPSLLPGWSAGSVMHCSSCHASESGRGGRGGGGAGGLRGSGAAGVHGSHFAPLLLARYETGDFTPESASAYGLCYQCHDRGSILSDASFAGHRLHIVDHRTPCAACHDAHGVSSTQGTPMANGHLINFATNIVFPDRVTGRLEYRDSGVFSGECFLSCHGVDHSPKRYPAEPGGAVAPVRRPPRR